MQLRKISIVLLALLLAAMAMVPMASAENQIVSKDKVLDMEGLKDSQVFKNGKNVDSPAASERLNMFSEYALVTVDTKAFMKDVDTKNQIPVTIRGRKVVLNLKSIPSPIDENTVIHFDDMGERSIIEAPLIKTYKGSIENVRNSDALFSVSDQAIVGHITLEGTRYEIDQMGPDMKDEGKPVHVIFDDSNRIKSQQTEVGPLDIHLITEPQATHGVVAANQKTTTIETVTASTTQIDLLVVVDSEFRQTYTDPLTEINNRISAANTALSPADVSFYVRSIRADNSLTATGTQALIEDFRYAYTQKRDADHCDVALLLTGKSLTGPLAGSFEYYGYSDAAWAVAQMVPRSYQGYTASPSHMNILVTHELGHTAGALHTHPNGDEPDPSWARPISWADGSTTKYSVMEQYFRGNDQLLQFSTDSWWPLGSHGDANHKNRQRIIEVKNIVAAFNN